MKAIKVEMVEFNELDKDKGYEVICDGGYTKRVSKEKFEKEYFKLADETGTKVLQDDIWNFLVKEETTRLGDKTVVVIDSTITGFDIIGTSVCADLDNFYMSIGQEIARRDVLDTLWGHMGFVLQWAKFGLVGNNKKETPKVPAHIARVIDEYKQLYERTQKLGVFINDNPLFKTLSEDEQSDMKDQLMAMQKYSNTLVSRLARIGIDCTKL